MWLNLVVVKGFLSLYTNTGSVSILLAVLFVFCTDCSEKMIIKYIYFFSPPFLFHSYSMVLGFLQIQASVSACICRVMPVLKLFFFFFTAVIGSSSFLF